MIFRGKYAIYVASKAKASRAGRWALVKHCAALSESSRSTEQVGSGQVDDFVTTAIQDGPDHVQVEIDDLI